MPPKTLLDDVADYYSAKLAEYGDSARGVDWKDERGQIARFEQLMTVVDRRSFSLNDLGCGYGALFDYLIANGYDVHYAGFDVSERMVEAATKRFCRHRDARFSVASSPDETADYAVASGIFNVRLGISDESWLTHIHAALATLDRTSRYGFAFNCLTSYCDANKMRDYLYYADPCTMFDYCKRHLSRHVALLHDYELYEFTMIVRKTPC